MTRSARSNKNGSTWAWRKLRAEVIAQETVCWLCGQRVDKTLPGTDPDGPSVDHVRPVSKGGTDARSNLRLSHLRCNTSRGARPPIQTRKSRIW